MFSFRSDKTGFFVTLILSTIALGTAIGVLVLIIVGMAQGDWKAHLFSAKWVLGSAWVGCILTVLIRLKIFDWQRRRAQRDKESSSENKERCSES